MRRTRGDDGDGQEASAADENDSGGQGRQGASDKTLAWVRGKYDFLIPPVNRSSYPTRSWDFQGYDTDIVPHQ